MENSDLKTFILHGWTEQHAAPSSRGAQSSLLKMVLYCVDCVEIVSLMELAPASSTPLLLLWICSSSARSSLQHGSFDAACSAEAESAVCGDG
jgi:hypothetical protein